ncbi:uncharacterized protein [Miscanthus floridulus]|uniref:uncharacterized protein n=1 Tax=Miscanthus floridulus TaxID=154761 RepID=UPI003458C46B
MPCEAGALKSGEAELPSIAEATEGEAEAPRTSDAEVVEAGASKAEVADAEDPRTTETEVAEAGAPETTKAEVAEAGLGAAELVAQDAEMEAGQASVPPLVQGLPPSQESAREVEVHSISSDDTSRGKEVVDTEVACTMEQPALTSGEGSSALVRELEARSLEKSMFLWREGDVWDQLWQQKDLHANANELLSAWSMEELEEELTRVAGERDTFRSRAEQEAASAKAIAKHMEAEQGAHLLTKGALAEAVKVAEASWGALHTGVKCALAIVSSHYADINLKAVSDGYVMAEDDEKAEEGVMKRVEAAEAPGTALARLFEEEVVPPTPTADAGNPEF